MAAKPEEKDNLEAAPAGDPPVESEAAVGASAGAGAPAPPDLPAFQPAPPSPRGKSIDLLSDVNLDVKIELGRTRMLVEDVLKLCDGAVVELDKLAGDPVDIFVNGHLIARGEVLVLNDNFCVRINEIVENPAEAATPKRKSA